jgi:hypothetical protein
VRPSKREYLRQRRTIRHRRLLEKCALTSSLFLEIHKVLLRKTAIVRTHFFSGFALAELCGVALTAHSRKKRVPPNFREKLFFLYRYPSATQKRGCPKKAAPLLYLADSARVKRLAQAVSHQIAGDHEQQAAQQQNQAFLHFPSPHFSNSASVQSTLWVSLSSTVCQVPSGSLSAAQGGKAAFSVQKAYKKYP